MTANYQTWSNGELTLKLDMNCFENDPPLYSMWVNEEYRGTITPEGIDQFCRSKGIDCPQFKGCKDQTYGGLFD